MKTQRFVAQLSVRGSSVAIPIPFDPDAVWGAKARHDVTGTVDGHPIRGPLQADRDGFVLPLGPAWRRDNGIDAPRSVTVELSPESPQVDDLASDIADALRAHPDARAFFESIAPFYRKNYLRWIDDARRPETRAKRIADTVTLLANRQLRR